MDQGGRIAIACDGNVFVTIDDRFGSPHGMSCSTWTLIFAKSFISSRMAQLPHNPYIGREQRFTRSLAQFDVR